MPELTAVETPKVAGFVDRGSNYARKRKKLEDEEAEIARLEAEARGEEITESEPSGESTEDTQVQASDDTEQKEEVSQEAEAQEDDSDLSPEEKSFKKRYGDVRRHLAAKEKEWKEKYEALEKMQNNKNIIPPKSDEDIEAWAKEYPDIAGIVETIAAKKAKEMFSKAESKLQELDDAAYEAQRIKSENAIRKVHSDFDDLRESDKFHDWAEQQPKWVKDALYENMDDPASVIRVIDLYKVDNGETPQAKKAKVKDAAKSVGRGSRTQLDADETAGQIKESEVSKMSAREFEEREEEITKAIKSGKFIYDLSGSAR